VCDWCCVGWGQELYAELTKSASESYLRSHWRRHAVALEAELGILQEAQGRYDLALLVYEKQHTMYSAESGTPCSSTSSRASPTASSSSRTSRVPRVLRQAPLAASWTGRWRPPAHPPQPQAPQQQPTSPSAPSAHHRWGVV